MELHKSSNLLNHNQQLRLYHAFMINCFVLNSYNYEPVSPNLVNYPE
uniref:Uncharacterized protein n=1 Tax=Anguilla anguilla TaxID=7936 RepID=A0A0E9XYE7_ANGAN